MHAFLDLSFAFRGTAENLREIEVRFPASDPVFSGHYPDYPVYPASLVVETCVALIYNHRGIDVCGGGWNLRDSRFAGRIGPGDTAIVSLSTAIDGCQVTVCVDKTVVATLDFVATDARAPVEFPNTSDIELRPASRFLPQRYPLMVIDLVGLAEDGASGSARKLVSYGDYAFRNFTPERADGTEPVYPVGGVIEGIEQSAAVILSQQWDFSDLSRMVLIGALRGVRIFGSAGPGDVITFATRLDMLSDGLATLSGVAHTADRLLMSIDKIVVIRREKSQ